MIYIRDVKRWVCFFLLSRGRGNGFLVFKKVFFDVSNVKYGNGLVSGVCEMDFFGILMIVWIFFSF